jgi:hypothetical protein
VEGVAAGSDWGAEGAGREKEGDVRAGECTNHPNWALGDRFRKRWWVGGRGRKEGLVSGNDDDDDGRVGGMICSG